MIYRKRNLLIIAVLLIYMIICIPVNAQTEPEHSQTMLTDVLKDKNQDIIDDFFCLEKVDDELKNYDLNTSPVLVVFPLALTNVYYEPLENEMAKVEDNSKVFFVLLQEEPVFLLGDKSKGEISIHIPYQTGTIPTYVRDVLSGTARQTFQGQECNVQNVICYDGDRVHNGITLIYETDRGRFVRHYAYTISEPIEFTWEEFVKLQNGYRKYRVSRIPDHSCGQTSFSEYSQKPERYKPKVPFWQKLLIAGGIVAIGAIAVFVGIRLRKRYLRRKYAYFDIEI